MSGKSIFDKLWDRHVITGVEGQPQLMYVDQHYIHEVTSPQAFQGLRDAGRKVRRPDLPLEPLITMFQRSIFLIFVM